MTVRQLPDLARLRALEARIRSSTDAEVADMLGTADGRWFFKECPRYVAADVSRRVLDVVKRRLPEGTIANLLR